MLAPGAARDLTRVGSNVFYGVATQLWITDGTVAGTRLVAQLATPFYLSGVFNFAEINGKIACTVVDRIGNSDGLYVSDGTVAGTVRVLDTGDGGLASPISQVPTPLGSVLVFGASVMSAGVGTELWRSDGTVGGTALVKDIRPGIAGSSPGAFGGSMADGRLLFAADDGVHAAELWVTDATTAVHEALRQRFAAETPVLPASA